MKYKSEKKISLPAPKSKRANSFDDLPPHVGKFALIKSPTSYRQVVFMTGDLVRISFNQRYVREESSMIQVISIADEIPAQKAYFGNHYALVKDYVKNITTIPKGTKVRIMSKEYPIPCNTVTKVILHKANMVTLEHEGIKCKIPDKFIEGVPYHSPDSKQARRASIMDSIREMEEGHEEPLYRLEPDPALINPYARYMEDE